MRRILCQALGVILSGTMLVSGLPEAFGAEAFVDMPDDWSTQALTSAVENGLLRGSAQDGGLWLLPGEPLKRAELAAVVNRAFGAERAVELTGVTDVPAGAWYAPDMARAAAMGTFVPDAQMRPEEPISRQEAFAVLARAFYLPDGRNEVLDVFPDGGQVAEWARGAVSGMVEAGYVSGSDGMLLPTAELTRAQFAQLMDALVKGYLSAPGEVTNLPGGTVLVQAPGVTLKDTAVRGDLILGDGVGDGTVTLDGVTIEGRLLVRGGGEHSVILTGATSVGRAVLARRDGLLRLRVEEGAQVDCVLIPDGSDNVTVAGPVGALTLAAPGVTVNAAGARIDRAEITGERSILVVEEDAQVGTADVAEPARGAQIVVAGQVESVRVEAPAASAVVKAGGRADEVTLGEDAEGAVVQADKGGTVQSVTSRADGAAIRGEGKIVSAQVEGSGNKVDTVGTKVTVSKGAEGTKANGQALKGGSTATTTGTGARPSAGSDRDDSSGGGGGGGSGDGGGTVPAGWDGTTVKAVTPEGDVYTISGPEELAWVAAQVNSGAETFGGKTVRLGADIDLNQKNWTPIGGEAHAFEGDLDGGGHTIKNLSITSAAAYGHLALFGRVAGREESHAAIRDVTVSGTVVNERPFDAGQDDDGRYTALVVAEAIYTDLSGVTARGVVSSGCRTAGGIAAMIKVEGTPEQEAASLRDCVNLASVSGRDQVGGVVGYTRTSGAGYMRVERCGNEGAVTASLNYAGGVTGLSGMTSFDQCYNKGPVSGAVSGGIVGAYGSGNRLSTYLTNSYNWGAVDGKAGAAGGILGLDATGDGRVQYCYSIGVVTTTNQPGDRTTSAGIYGSTSGNFPTKFINNYYLAETAHFGACGGFEPAGAGGAEVTGQADISGQFEVVAEEELKSAATALALNNGEQTESAPWRTVAGGWPVLAWEEAPGAELPVPAACDGEEACTQP